MFVQRIILKMADHSEEGELPHIKLGFTWQAPSQEEYNRPWDLLVEMLQVLNSNLLVPVHYSHFFTTKSKGGQTREKNWSTIDSMDTQLCNSVT